MPGRLEQGEIERGAVDLCHHAGESGAGADVYQRSGHLRLGGEQERIDKMLVLDPLGVGDRSEVDLLIRLHQQRGIPVQQLCLLPVDRDAAAGGIVEKNAAVQSFFSLPSLPAGRAPGQSTDNTARSAGLTRESVRPDPDSSAAPLSASPRLQPDPLDLLIIQIGRNPDLLLPGQRLNLLLLAADVSLVFDLGLELACHMGADLLPRPDHPRSAQHS